jgi:membrane-associated phospholipid phosphatase
MSGPLNSLAFAQFLSNAINPALTFLSLTAPWIDRRWNSSTTRRLRTIPWMLASVAGIGLTVILAESGKHFSVWPGHPNFPSGHESFAASAATCLIVRDRRWAWVAVPLALTIGGALVAAGYHRPIEVVGGMILGAVVAGSIVGFVPHKLNEERVVEKPPATGKY